jgi:NADPH:quinone reductase-like Zn-dependent oxidoreductase
LAKSLLFLDRVCGCIYGGNALNPADGAYGEYITAKGDVQIMMPQNLSFEEAATLGVAILTIGKTLHQILELPLPPETITASFPILIYGGSTATGAVAIQFAKLSGCQVITTCSPHNFGYVKSLGADKTFDYHSPTYAKEINDFTSNKLAYVMDCISARGAPEICFNAMSDSLRGHCTHIDWPLGEQVTTLRSNVGAELIYRTEGVW